MANEKPNTENKRPINFIEEIIEDDLKAGLNDGRIHTRFPPEPNGYLHIGHSKAICLDFGLAKKYGGECNLRFDDTNPIKEDTEYVDAIKEDIQWLGFDWGKNEFFASDHFQKLFDYALVLIDKGLAYVDDQPADVIAKQKGTPTEAGEDSPFRSRSVEENKDLFLRMNKGEFNEGARVLRAKIDMASPNMHMRDPIIYRIIQTPHHRTGDTWKVYPMYDFAHGQCDYFEGITHSLCTLEFEVHRPLYDWFVEGLKTEDYQPKQREFNRLNLNYTVMSKRKLLQLVQENYVSGWDDPRMPTISGLRRRGYTPESIHNFIDSIGYTKVIANNDVALLENSIREDLNKKASRVNAVLDPLKVTITNYPEDGEEWLDAVNNPEDESAGTRQIPFSNTLYIEKEDFMVDPPKKFFRLGPGREVRFKNAYFLTCTDYKTDPETGEVIELLCTYDEDTKSGTPGSNRKVKGTLHWVSAKHCIDAEVRLYDRLFSDENPDGPNKNFLEHLNPESLKVITAKVEPWLQNAKEMDKFQFQRIGYYCVDKDSTSEKLVFNRTVGLKNSWAKQGQNQNQQKKKK